VGSELDLTKSRLATLSPGCVHLFMGGTRNNRSDMLRLSFDFLEDHLPPSSTARLFSSPDLNEVPCLREPLFLCLQVGNSHSGFDPVREVRIDQPSKRYSGECFNYLDASEAKLRDYHSRLLSLSGLLHGCLAPIIKFCDPEVGHGPVVVSPFYSHGCLSSHALSARKRPLLVGQLAFGPGFLHFEHIIHESLRPSKLLIDDESHLRINGFATSEPVRSGIIDFWKITDVTYAGPECFASDWSNCDFSPRSKCDVYSLGLVLCELFFKWLFTVADPPAGSLARLQRCYDTVSIGAVRRRSEVPNANPEPSKDSRNPSGAAGNQAAVKDEGARSPDGVEETVRDPDLRPFLRFGPWSWNRAISSRNRSPLELPSTLSLDHGPRFQLASILNCAT
jgi:hypothetical protein